MIIIVVVMSSNNNALLLLSVDGLVHYLLLPLSLPRSIALSVHLSCSLGGQKYAKILRNYCDFYNFANTKQICWHAQSICLRAQTFAIVIKFVVLQHIPQALDSIYCVLLCMCRNCVCIVLDISAISKQMQMHSYRTVVCVMFWFSIEFTWLYFCWLPNGIGASVGVATVSQLLHEFLEQFYVCVENPGQKSTGKQQTFLIAVKCIKINCEPSTNKWELYIYLYIYEYICELHMINFNYLRCCSIDQISLRLAPVEHFLNFFILNTSKLCTRI